MNKKKLQSFLSNFSKELRNSLDLPSNQVVLENPQLCLPLANIELRKAQETGDKVFIKNTIIYLLLYLFLNEPQTN